MPGLRSTPSNIERATLAKVTRRLIPFLFVLYIACYLDRVNVGFAALQMNRDLGFSSAVYGFGAGIFFIGYSLFEVPSNLLLARIGARVWIARIMITWGLLASAMMFVKGPTSFYVLRFLLGVAEAGFFPGIIFYLSQWFPAAERSPAIARFMTAIPISGVIGGPVSGAILGFDGQLGLRGWQWLFLLEGIPSVLLGVVVLLYLTQSPDNAMWLEPAQRTWLAARLRQERDQCEQQHGLSVVQALRSGTVWELALLVFFGVGLGQYAFVLWLPQIVKGFGGLSDLMVGMVVTVPYIVAAVAMVLVGVRADKSGDRAWYVAAASAITALGFVASAYFRSPVPVMFALSLTAAGSFSFHGPFWTLPSLFLTGSAAAGGIAMINSVSALSGFVGPYVVGVLRGSSGNFQTGFLLLALAQLGGTAIALHLRRAPRLAGLPGLPSAAPAAHA